MRRTVPHRNSSSKSPTKNFCEFLCFLCEIRKRAMRALADRDLFHTEITENTEKRERKKMKNENFCEFLCFLCEMKESHAGSRRKRFISHRNHRKHRKKREKKMKIENFCEFLCFLCEIRKRAMRALADRDLFHTENTEITERRERLGISDGQMIDM